MRNPNLISKIYLAVLLTAAGAFVAGRAGVTAAESGGRDVVEARGVLQSSSRVELRNETGRAFPLLHIAPEGKPAKKGALLAELDSSGLVEEREEAELRVQTARAKMDTAKAIMAEAREESELLVKVAEQALVVAEGTLEMFDGEQGEYQLQVRALEGEIALAEQRLGLCESRVEHLKSMSESGRAEIYELVEARLAVLEGRQELESARSKLTFLRERVRGQRLQELKLAVARRRLELVQARGKVQVSARTGEMSLIVEQAGLNIETRRLKRLEEQIAASRIHAPRDGTVMHFGTEGADLKRGSIVREGQPILQLVDTERLKLEVRVSLEVAQKVSTGESIPVRIDAFRERRFRGRVARMAVITEPSPPVWARVTIIMEEGVEGLREGMTAVAEFDAAE